MLVIPSELSGRRVQRHSRVAIQIGRSGARNGVRIAVVPLQSLIGHWICDAPISELAHRIVGSRQPPSGCLPLVDRRAAPAFISRLAGGWGGVETPRFPPR